ncbi:MAG: glucose 1-dehydrogenase [Gemmataceae bacterium]
MTSLFDLSGKKALVTGATRGIGLVVAQALIAQGAEVIITGRKAETVEAAVEQLRLTGGRIHGIPCHQGNPAAIEALFTRLDSDGIVPDIAVINAATNPAMGGLLDVELDAWQKILEVNLTGALLTARGAIRRMLPQQRGSVVFMASVAGIEPMVGLGAYSVSKAGLLGLMRGLSREVGSDNIRVNAIAPGLVETRFAQALFEDKPTYETVLQRTPLGRHGQPRDIAGAVLFLASEAAAWVTGQVLIVDGGGRV